MTEAATGRPPARHMVIHHTTAEDFTVYEPAGFVLRWYALTLDLALSTPLDVLVHLPFNRYLERLSAYGHDYRYALLSGLLTAIPILAYFIAPTFLFGKTLGKHIVGLRVVRMARGPRLSLWQVLARETVGKVLSLVTLGIGFLMVASNRDRRALHDHLFGTQVISYRER